MFDHCQWHTSRYRLVPGWYAIAVLAPSSAHLWVVQWSLLYGLQEHGEAYLVPTSHSCGHSCHINPSIKVTQNGQLAWVLVAVVVPLIAHSLRWTSLSPQERRETALMPLPCHMWNSHMACWSWMSVTPLCMAMPATTTASQLPLSIISELPHNIDCTCRSNHYEHMKSWCHDDMSQAIWKPFSVLHHVALHHHVCT